MTRTIRVLPEHLTEAIFEAGNRKLVYLEGESDVDVFEEWYKERLGEIDFQDAGGRNGVRARLSEELPLSRHKAIYGIIDRDFREDEEVDAALESADHLLILRRYSIENYLLEPNAVHREATTFLGAKSTFPDQSGTEAALLNLCRELLPVMAANWLLIENELKPLPDGYPDNAPQELVDYVAKMLTCDAGDANERLTDKEARIEPHLAALETAHTRTSGKHLFHRVCAFVNSHRSTATRKRPSPEINQAHFRNLLRNRIKETTGIHADIREIVEKRILGLAIT